MQTYCNKPDELIMTSPDIMLSIVIPTLNSADTLRECLNSVTTQSVPRDQYEIILADAGSRDRTREIATQCGVDKIVENTLKTGEAGKSAGIKASSGALIALIDSDNFLPDSEWLARMIKPFDDPDIVAAEPIAWTVREQDPALTRYFSMLGMCDPLCLFLKNYDKVCEITGRWTGLHVKEEDCGDYLKLTLNTDTLPTIGANGYVFRRSLLPLVNWEPYYFDIDAVYESILAGKPHFAKVKTSIVHLYCVTLSDFARKQRRRIKDFLFFTEEKKRTYPWRRQQNIGILWFCLSTVLNIPLLWQMARGYARKPDRAWLYHIPACWITLWVYGCASLSKIAGVKQAPVHRDRWQTE